MLTAQLRTHLFRTMRRKFKHEIAEMRNGIERCYWSPSEVIAFLETHGWLHLYDNAIADFAVEEGCVDLWKRPVLQSVCGDFVIKNGQFTITKRYHRHFIPTVFITGVPYKDAPATHFNYPWVLQPVADVTPRSGREAHRALKNARDMPEGADLHEANVGMFLNTPTMFDW